MSTSTLDNIRDEKGKLPEFAWPGGYPILYLDKENSVLCAKCANTLDTVEEDWSDDKPTAYFIYWEGPAEICEECNCDIESAYGNPDEEEEN